jgi:hypothetical protein
MDGVLFPARFNTELTRALRLSLSWARPIQSTSPHPTSTRSILILSNHLRLGLPSDLLPSGFPTNNLCAFVFSPIRATFPAHLIQYINTYNALNYISNKWVSRTLIGFIWLGIGFSEKTLWVRQWTLILKRGKVVFYKLRSILAYRRKCSEDCLVSRDRLCRFNLRKIVTMKSNLNSSFILIGVRSCTQILFLINLLSLF